MRPAWSLGTSVDSDGRYEFTGLPVGSYRITASARLRQTLAFRQASPFQPAAPLALAKGERRDAVDILLPALGVIEGQIVDEFGDPAPDVSVRPMSVGYVGRRRTLIPAVTENRSVKTDDMGRYHFSGIPAGNYYVVAAAGAFAGPEAPGGFALTYYPGLLEEPAQGVRLDWGQHLANVNFVMTPAPSGQIRGVAKYELGGGVASGVAWLVPSNMAQGVVVTSVTTSSDGSFSFDSVPWGQYTVQVFGPAPGAAGRERTVLANSMFGWTTVFLGSDRLDGANVTVRPRSVARGRVVLPLGLSSTPAPSQVVLSAVPIDWEGTPIAGGVPPFSVSEDWAFEIRGLAGRRVLRATCSREGYALERIMLNDEDVTDKPIEFGQGHDISGLEVVLTDQTGSVSGGVAGADGTPASAYVVVLFADSPEQWQFPSRFIKLASADILNRFKVSGVLPGEYLVVAIPFVQGSEWQDPSFLLELRKAATRVTVRAGTDASVTLRLSSR